MKKFFSLIAAVLFAGSTMATEVTVSKTVPELVTAYSWENGSVVTPFALDEVITVSTEATDANTGKYYVGGNQVRLYQTGAAKLFISAAEGYTISSITLTYVSYNTGILKEAESGVAVDFDNVQSATFTVGNSGTATNGQVRLTAFSVTYNGEGEVPPTPSVNYYVAGSMNGWAADAAYMLTPNNENLYEGEFTFAANDEFKVIGFDGEKTTWFPEGMGNNFQITEAGDYKITFNPAGNVEGWYAGFFNVVKKEAPIVHQYEVAEAIAAGLQENDEVLVRGVITKMEFKGANFARYGSVNIYVADATDAEGEFEFFNCYSLNADTFRTSIPNYDPTDKNWAQFREVADENGNTIHVGDTVIAFGKYKLYNTTHELNTGCYLVNIKHAAVTPVEGDTIDVTISSITTPGALVWTDAVASEGWWQMMGGNENYEFSLSNVSTTETAGVYTIDDLDSDYSYITVMTATDTTDVYFVDGSVTVAISETGVVTIVGALVGDDGNTYNFDLTYVDPKAEKTVNVTISDGNLYDVYASSGLYAVYGTADDNTAYVQLGIWANTFSGNFTEEDLDLQYIGSYVQDATGYNQIYTAAITVTPGNGEGVYSITADLLCYNNTLYKVTMKIGAAQGEGVDNVDAAVEAIKRLVNGNVVIEKAGKAYNMNGAVVR